jgi:hypothetical protein
MTQTSRTERPAAPGHISHAAPRVSSTLTKPVPAGMMAIVPGDRIATNRVETYTFDDVATALAKRYRGEKNQLAARAADYIDQTLGKYKTLHDAVEYVKNCLVEDDGNANNVILTSAELKEREINSEANGILGALIKCLAKGDQDEKAIKTTMRPQFSMRRIKRDADQTCGALLRALKYDGFVYISGRGDAFSLRKDNQLNPDSYCAYYKRVIFGE